MCSLVSTNGRHALLPGQLQDILVHFPSQSGRHYAKFLDFWDCSTCEAIVARTGFVFHHFGDHIPSLDQPTTTKTSIDSCCDNVLLIFRRKCFTGNSENTDRCPWPWTHGTRMIRKVGMDLETAALLLQLSSRSLWLLIPQFLVIGKKYRNLIVACGFRITEIIVC